MTWLTVYREAAGWLVAVQVACLAYATWLVKRKPRSVLTAAKAVPEPCPWCGTRDCLDSTLCNCKTPCGSWLCVVKEAAGG